MKQWITKHLEVEAAKYHSGLNITGNREVLRVDPKYPALVLGSSQSKNLVSLKSAEIDLIVRRSGGGIVHLHPGHFLWIDICIPKSDSLYEDDISKASIWVGELWQEVLLSFEVNTDIYLGPYNKGLNDGLICFSSRAQGEVMMGEQKLVGISQRRSKLGICFQTLLLLDWQPEAMLEYLNPYLEMSAPKKETFIKQLKEVAISVDLDPQALTEAFFSHILNK